jgi:hypothetical protein
MKKLRIGCLNDLGGGKQCPPSTTGFSSVHAVVKYHGLPITPGSAAAVVAQAGHVFVSRAHPGQLGTAIEFSQSFALDNGAFPAWKSGVPILDWAPYYDWVGGILRMPHCDFAVVPDVIDGSASDNDALLREWPFPRWSGAPVWHMHEKFDRLERIASEWPRICIGSSGQYSKVGTLDWDVRMAQAMCVLCDANGFPRVKIHGLRMLNPKVFTRYPLSSADSTNIGRNINLDTAWRGTYLPPTKEARARVMRERIEFHNSPPRWGFNID